MARSDYVTSSHTLFGFTVVILSLPRSYNIQVKNSVALKKRIDDFLERLQVPENAISGTLARYIMYSLLTFRKD